jgi:NhaP-type Na+/H+ or K+/H+ antiporter
MPAGMHVKLLKKRYVPNSISSPRPNIFLQESVDLMASNLFFLLLGAALPWGLWFRDPQLSWWKLVLLPLSFFALKRIPLFLALYR